MRTLKSLIAATAVLLATTSLATEEKAASTKGKPAATASEAAKGKGSESIASKHEALFTSIDHLKVQFDQKTYRKLRNRTVSRKGTAYFSKPASFRWSYEPRGAQGAEEYFYDGKTLAHYQKDQNLVTEYGTRSSFSRELQNIVNLVLDARKLLDDFEPVAEKKVKGDTAVTLVPRKKNTSDISQIYVQVSEQRKYVKEVKIDYNDGNSTTFEFKNPRFGPLPADTFQFKNPGTVKVKRVG